MKKIAVFCAMGATLAGFAAVAADGVVITTAGEYPFEAGETYGAITNKAADGEVKLTSTGTATAADAISVGMFNATVAGAQTLFSGGYWDFGATDRTTNFFSTGQTLANRTTTLDNGAQVVNVGTMFLGGTGTNNVLSLEGQSSFAAKKIVMGSKQSNQSSQIAVTDGSSLACEGALQMSMCTVSTTAGAQYRTGNRLLVSGEGSRLTVGGTMGLGADNEEGKVFGYQGGNTLEVTDGAEATFNSLSLGQDTRHGLYNKVVFGKNARVTITNTYIATNGDKSFPPGSNAVEIVDGAVVTNTGHFNFGAHNQGLADGCNSLLVSNATFYAAKGRDPSDNKVHYFLSGPRSTFRLSGPNASFKIGSLDAVFHGEGSTFIVENGAQYAYPKQGFSYTVAAYNETLIVRDRAVVTVPSGFKPTSAGAKTELGTNNAIVVESDAVLKCPNGPISIYGKHNRLVVSNATVQAVGNKMMIGTDGAATGSPYGSNCLLRVSGSRPRVSATWYVYVWIDSTLHIDLPAEGYEDGCATDAQPLVSGGHGVSFDASSRLEISGGEALLKHHLEAGRKATYVLLGGDNLVISDEQIAAAQATLPEGLTLRRSTGSSSKKQLVLDVKPKFGMMFIVR